jgi:hypothetical protein
VLIVSCGNEVKQKQSVSIPYLIQCSKVVEKVERAFDVVSQNKDYDLVVEVKHFDKSLALNEDFLGVIVLTVYGDWVGQNDLKNYTAKDYLMVHANGIIAECYPENYLQVEEEYISDLTERLKRMSEAYEENIYLNYEKGQGISIYFNDGSYKYPDY